MGRCFAKAKTIVTEPSGHHQATKASIFSRPFAITPRATEHQRVTHSSRVRPFFFVSFYLFFHNVADFSLICSLHWLVSEMGTRDFFFPFCFLQRVRTGSYWIWVSAFQMENIRGFFSNLKRRMSYWKLCGVAPSVVEQQQ